MMLNLASGTNTLPGYVNVDVITAPNVERVNLFHFPWPWPDDSIGHVRCHGFLEHIPHTIPGHDRDGFLLFMEEVFRVLQPGGTFEAVVPHYRNPDHDLDPTHTRRVHPRVWDFFSPVAPIDIGHAPTYTHARFKVIESAGVPRLNIGPHTAHSFRRRFGRWPPVMPWLLPPHEWFFKLEKMRGFGGTPKC